MKIQLNDNGTLTDSPYLVWDEANNILKVLDSFQNASNYTGWRIGPSGTQYFGAGIAANGKNANFGNTIGGGINFQGIYFAPTSPVDLGTKNQPWGSITHKGSLINYNFNASTVDFERARFGFIGNELHVGFEQGGKGLVRRAIFGSFDANGKPKTGFRTWGIGADRLCFFVKDQDDAQMVLSETEVKLGRDMMIGWVERGNANEDTFDVAYARSAPAEIEINTGKRGKLGGLKLKYVYASKGLYAYGLNIGPNDWERGTMAWNKDVLEIGAEASGIGYVRHVRILGDKIMMDLLQLKPVPLGYLPLPKVAGDGARAHINDAIDPKWGAIATGGGYKSTPVWCDGEFWRVG